jgi:hypothetical protein
MSDDGVRIWIGGELVLSAWRANNGVRAMKITGLEYKKKKNGTNCIHISWLSKSDQTTDHQESRANQPKSKIPQIAWTALAFTAAGLTVLLLVQYAPQWVRPFLELFK